MFDIIRDIWQNPGPAFSPMPFWFWNDTLDRDELVRQLDSFHRKGIDGVVIHPRLGMSGVGYLSDGYFDLVKTVCEEAKRRFMLVILYDEGMYPSGSAHGEVVREEPRFAARRLYAVPEGTAIPRDEDPQFRLWLRFREGKLADVKLDRPRDAADDWQPYLLVLGYTGGTIRGLSPDEDDGQPNAPKAADLLNPMATECFIRHTHEKYSGAIGEYFGQTVIGFFTDEPSVTGRCAHLDGGIPWSYDMIEDFFEAGGDFSHLAALLFEPEDKKLRREAERIHAETVRRRLGEAFYAPLSRWCRAHGIALMGHPAASGDCDTLKYFDIPGQDLVWRMVEPGTELTSPDSILAKSAADAARHRGLSRSSVEAFGVCGERGNPWNFPPDEMMWYLNFLFARGTSWILPHAFYYSLRTPLQSGERPPDVGPASVWWKDYRKLAGYIKRMSWLNATGSDNPEAAVLCSPEHTPVKPVEDLYRDMRPFNYLSLEDFMERAHIDDDGHVVIDRYHYDTVLIEGRLRLNAEIVTKLGEFEVHGGHLYRGSDFAGYLAKIKKDRPHFFEGETHGNLRFTHMSKSGCEFFSFINEGLAPIRGRFVTSLSQAAYRFDPFTGGIEPLTGQMCGGGFAYPAEIPGHAALVIGFDPSALPVLGEPEEERIVEIVSLAEGRMAFDWRPAENRRAVLTFEGMHDAGDVTVNGKAAGRILFRPYALDITALLVPGENEIAVEVTPSPANRYGTPVPVGFDGCAVRVYEKAE